MLLQIIFLILNVYELLLLGRVLLSWFPNVDYRNPLVQFLYEVTEPVLRPVRQWLGGMGMSGMMDFSPLVVFLVIRVLMIILPTFLRY